MTVYTVYTHMAAVQFFFAVNFICTKRRGKYRGCSMITYSSHDDTATKIQRECNANHTFVKLLYTLVPSGRRCYSLYYYTLRMTRVLYQHVMHMHD